MERKIKIKRKEKDGAGQARAPWVEGSNVVVGRDVLPPAGALIHSLTPAATGKLRLRRCQKRGNESRGAGTENDKLF